MILFGVLQPKNKNAHREQQVFKCIQEISEYIKPGQLCFVDIVGKDVNKKGAGQIKHEGNDHPKPVIIVNKQRGGIVELFVEVIKRKDQDKDGLYANRDGVDLAELGKQAVQQEKDAKDHGGCADEVADPLFLDTHPDKKGKAAVFKNRYQAEIEPPNGAALMNIGKQQGAQVRDGCIQYDQLQLFLTFAFRKKEQEKTDREKIGKDSGIVKKAFYRMDISSKIENLLSKKYSFRF
ncbi:hypothetical protein V9K67_11670 [Paraflavisolibacter sp. H34]|uniref:hypothetical protein n=1 Tax=Huijunlia imazamoxiresistens TaxID=3127457 RepID=UPI00301A7F33